LLEVTDRYHSIPSSGDTAAGAGNWKYTTVPSRPGTAPTSSSQTTLVTLKTNEIYPDSSDTSSSGSDQVKFQYNVAGEMTQSTDQRGTVIRFTVTTVPIA
jgi:hypothetical protein